MPESVESLPVVMGEINVRVPTPTASRGAAVSAVALAGGDSRSLSR